MPSPFPGMDPWLESPGVFPDIHDALIFLIREALNASLPSGFRALGANRIWMDEDQQREPDVSVMRPATWESPPNGAVATEAFTRVGMLDVESTFLPEPVVEKFVEIYSTTGDRLVTAIKVLSLSNKTPGNSRGAYRQKQSECRSQNVNLVEIDLLRGGVHTTAIPVGQLRQRAGQFDYHVCVSAADLMGHYFVAPFHLVDRMPTIAIPLDESHEPVPLDLQPLFDRAYDTGRHRATNYAERKPSPPLTPEQQAWAEGILREQGLLK
jgi:hypothetical protein